MGITDYISKKKAQFQQARKETAARQAVYENNPDIELKDLKAEKQLLDTKDKAAKLRTELKEKKFSQSNVGKFLGGIKNLKKSDSKAGRVVGGQSERATVFGGMPKAQKGSAFSGGGIFRR